MKRKTDYELLMEHRASQMQSIREASIRGDPICAATEALMGLAEQSGYYINGAIDHRDEDEDDDIRPY